MISLKVAEDLCRKFECITGQSVEDWTSFEELPQSNRKPEEILRALESCIIGQLNVEVDHKHLLFADIRDLAALGCEVRTLLI